MSLTAVVTNHNYARFLPECIDSALLYCDEILVYDDASTDDSRDVLAGYGDRIKVTTRDDCTGCPVWGSNLGIEQATSSHLIFLDADNYLVSQPPQTPTDYVFAPIPVIQNGRQRTLWRFGEFATDAREAFRQFTESTPYPRMPFPWGGVWRTDWLRDKRWREFETTQFAADFRTAIDWCKCAPTLAYHTTPFLAFRKHPDQWSESPERDTMYAEARIAQSEPWPER